MKLQHIIFLISLLFMIVGCRPEQAATEYNIADNIPLEVEVIDESAKDSEEPTQGDVPDNGNSRSLGDYVADCETATQLNALMEVSYTVNFPAAIECDFNEQGQTAQDLNAAVNGPRIDGWFMARNESYFPINFPEQATLCDVKFNFPEQSMKYDDEIFLTMNKNILIASQNYSTQVNAAPFKNNGLAVNDLGLMQWKWMGPNGLFNLPYEKPGKYCLGLSPNDPEYNNKCNIPATDTLGKMKLDLPSNEAIKLNMSNNSDQIEFGFITTGDNDNGDCEHSAYSFEVVMKYVQN